MDIKPRHKVMRLYFYSKILKHTGLVRFEIVVLAVNGFFGVLSGG